MVEVSVRGPMLHLEVLGWDKLWAFKSRLEIPLAHVTSVRMLSGLDELKALSRELGFGLRMPGTDVPGLITAGSYKFSRGGWVFIDVHRPFDRIVLIELTDEPYRKLAVEVEDPEATVRVIKDAVGARDTAETGVG